MSSTTNSLCPILLLDGGLGTTLELPPYNIEFSSSTPLWSSHLLISSPDTLLDVQEDFVKAGADILTTATYQASFEGFATTLTSSADNPKPKYGVHGIAGESGAAGGTVNYNHHEGANELMLSAISISRKAFMTSSLPSDRHQFVALSLGAYGACMSPSQEYTGRYEPSKMLTVDCLTEWHAKRLSVFSSSPRAWTDVDFVAFETLPLRNEILAARSTMARCTTEADEKPWWVSCVFPNDDLSLPDGSTVAEVVEALLGSDTGRLPKPWGIGINCTKVRRLDALIMEFESAVRSTIPDSQKWPWLVIYPDGSDGLVYNSQKQAWEAEKNAVEVDKRAWDEAVFDIVKRTRDRGNWAGIVVGGCCKTSPEDIARLRKRIDEM